MKYIFGTNKPKSGYNVQYAFFRLSGNVIDICHESTTCTDYLTDLLMYPESKIGVKQYDLPHETDCTQVVVSFNGITECNTFCKIGLPLLHKIEKLNGFKQTKTYRDGANLIVFASKKWMHSTYTLSLFLKIFCNFSNTLPNTFRNINTHDRYDLRNELMWKIILTGNLCSVNRGLKYKHGWKLADNGNHNNNGIHATHENYRWIKTTVVTKNDWNYYDYMKKKSKFLRLRSLAKLEEQLKDVDVNALWKELL